LAPLSSISTRNLIFLLFIACCIASSLSCRFSPLTPADVAIHNPYSSFDYCLRVKDSTTIGMAINLSLPAAEYQWETSLGSIRGHGNRVTYIASGGGGTARIHLRVLSGTTVLSERRYSIFVYKQLVLLRADDLKYFGSDIFPPQWERFIGYIKSKGIVAALGLIGRSLDQGSPAYDAMVASLQSSGSFEIWNHGYTHDITPQWDEFRNTSYDDQKNHLMLTQNLASQKLDITLHAFGAPGGYIDSNTTKAIDQIDDIKIWFGGDPRSKKTIVGPSGCFIESPTFVPNYQNFIKTYSADTSFYMLYCHPFEWNEAQFETFQKIIDYLMEEGVTFVTPTQYYESFASKRNVRANG